MPGFRSYTESVTVSTEGNNDIIDISPHIAAAVARSGVRTGVVFVSVPHTTCALTSMEFEPGAIADLKRFLDEWVPSSRRYRHNELNHDTNGHAHLRAALLGPSIHLPVSGGKPVLGTWQTPVMVDFDDRPRRRKLTTTVLGSTLD